MATELEAETHLDALDSAWDELSMTSAKRLSALSRIGELHMESKKLRARIYDIDSESKDLEHLVSCLTVGNDNLRESIVKLSDLPDGTYTFDVANRRVVPSGSISDISNG